MCGRYTFFDVSKLYERFGVNDRIDWDRARYNVTPGSLMPVVLRQSPNSVKIMKWGLVPFWAKDPRIGYRMINARAETIESKPAFRKPFLAQRCLVPANGFFEWQHANGKQPYYIELAGRPVFTMAGLYDRWTDAEGKETLSYTIITTAANAMMTPIHNRMPVILTPEAETEWLDPTVTDKVRLKSILTQNANDKLKAYPVSKEVNQTSNDNSDLIKEIKI